MALGLFGAALLLAAESKWRRGTTTDAWITASFGGVFCVAAVGLIGPMRREVARAQDRRRREEARPNEPWTWNPAWSARTGIAQSGRRHGRLLIFFGVTAILISSPAWLSFPRELSRGNHAIWVALIFPLVGVGILAVAANDARRRRKYGSARFVADALPLALNAELAGMLIVDRPVVAIGPGRVSVDCWCTTITRRGKSRQHDQVVAHTDREISPSDWKTDAGESQLFIQVPLRGGSSTTMSKLNPDNPVYEWRLRVEAPTAGADFVAEFVLPVFDVTSGLVSDASRGLTPAQFRRIDRGEVWRAAGIHERAQAGAVEGMALEFPHGQGRKLIGAPLAMFVIFGGLAVVLGLSPAPKVFAVFFGLFALLPALTFRALWSGGGEQVWIEPDAVCIQKGTRPLRRIVHAEVQAIEANKNVGVGTQQFFRIVARARPAVAGRIPGRIEIASMVRGDEAAQEVIGWLQERMSRASV